MELARGGIVTDIYLYSGGIQCNFFGFCGLPSIQAEKRDILGFTRIYWDPLGLRWDSTGFTRSHLK